MNNLTHIDLFSGIGGFALACRWAGIETIAFCDNDKFCQKALNKNFPNIPILGDIKELDGKQFDNPFILTGGFPCQPFSVAGKRKGTADDRWLWKEMFRIIQECQSRWVIGENVAGIVNMALDEVLSDLESIGYETQPIVIPACAVGAPQRRDRIWIIANSSSERKRARFNKISKTNEKISKRNENTEFKQSNSDATDSDSEYIEEHKRRNQLRQTGRERIFRRCIYEPDWNTNWFEVATRLCRVDDGLYRQMDRSKRLKALGNAIVPQVAYEIIKGILKVESEQNDSTRKNPRTRGFNPL